MGFSICDRLQSYYEVLLLFTVAMALFPLTVMSYPMLLVTSPSDFRSRWFERLWALIGPSRSAHDKQALHTDEIMSRASGMVLEIGPGTGEQSHHFRPQQIKKIYGAEPNIYMHEKLLEKAKTTGLEGKYIPMLAGAEPSSLIPALQQQGLVPKGSITLPEEGIFDYIVSVKVMCSVPKEHTAATVAVFQRLLKPHGEFLFFEHVENNSDVMTQWIVRIFGWMWPYATGGCRLNSKLDRTVLSMGGWSERRVRTTEEFQGFEILRYVKGICTKA